MRERTSGQIGSEALAEKTKQIGLGVDVGTTPQAQILESVEICVDGFGRRLFEVLQRRAVGGDRGRLRADKASPHTAKQGQKIAEIRGVETQPHER